MIYDCHAHLDLFNEKELKKIIENSKKQSIGAVISNSVDLNSCRKNLEISKKYSLVKCAFGFYPQDALSRETNKKIKDSFQDLKKFVLKNKKSVFAIGEIGMDFSSGKDKEGQEELFRQQLLFAEKLGVPAIIHTRKAEKEVIGVLKDFPKLKKILHCFCGNMKLAKKAEQQGCYFSIPCSVNRMQNFQKLLELVSKEKILTETDAPYLSPFKGKKSEPAYIRETIKIMANIWNMSEEKVEKQIEENFKKVFQIKE